MLNVGRGLMIGGLLVALLAMQSAPVDAEPVTADSFLAAPEGCWPSARACPGGTRATRTRPVVGDLSEAWSFPGPDSGVKGKVCWPPLVWNRRVWVTLMEKSGKYVIHVLNLHDGSAIARPLALRSNVHPQPSIWNNRLLVRRGDKDLRLYEMRDGKFRDVWRIKSKEGFEFPLLHERRVYVRDAGKIAAYDPPRHEPRWTASLTTEGAYAVCGRGTYGLHIDDQSALLTNSNSSHHVYVSVPEDPTQASPIGESEVVALHEGFAVNIGRMNERAKDGRWINGAAVSLRGPAWGWWWNQNRLAHEKGMRLPLQVGPNVSRLSLMGPVVETPMGSLAVVNGKRAPMLLHSSEGVPAPFDASYVLASREHHSEFAPGTPLMSVAQDVVYVGRRAFRMSDLKIVWEGDMEVEYAPVPAHRRLLLVDKQHRLHALAPDEGMQRLGDTFGPSSLPGAKPRAVADGLVFFASGRTHDGAYTFHPDDGHVEIPKGKKGTEVVPREVLRLLLDDDGAVVYAESIDDIPPALLDYQARQGIDELRDVARLFHAAADKVNLARLIEECERLGLDEKHIALLRKGLAGIERTKPKLKEKKAKKAHEAEVALEAQRVVIVTRALAPLLDDGRSKLRLLALRQLLTVDPESDAGLAALRRWLPDFLEQHIGADPAAWVDVAVALRGRGLSEVDPASTGTSSSSALRAMAQMRRALEREISGLESDRLVIVTPLDQPRAIARCIVLGELVCDALEEVFGVEPGKGAAGDPMVMQLFQDRDAYIRVTARGPGENMIKHSAGHYDPRTRVSRIFLPEGDDGWERTMATYAHELTHQWIDNRCPRFKPAEIRSGTRQPGFWIVEGMAELLSEFQWNVELRTWKTASKRSSSLDVVANLKKTELLPWSTFFQISQAHFARLNSEHSLKTPQRWTIGMVSLLSESHLFYAQAGAVCQYLYHSGDAGREALCRYVELYYRGIPGGDSIPQTLGMTATQLGERVVQFAKAQR